jgi:hypothetical protein
VPGYDQVVPAGRIHFPRRGFDYVSAGGGVTLGDFFASAVGTKIQQHRVARLCAAPSGRMPINKLTQAKAWAMLSWPFGPKLYPNQIISYHYVIFTSESFL